MKENLNLLENVHIGLEAPSNHGLTSLVKGDYFYYHYLCDGLDDRVTKFYVLSVSRNIFPNFQELSFRFY